ncbi:MAG: hypothetical protein IIX14_07920, partial [Clostridia bacterium]|nr:hypothetical protein [Clostridia bacterium]
DFIQCGFLVSQGKNAVNPFGLASILTQDERKSACRKHGSDNSFHPNLNFITKNPRPRGLGFFFIPFPEILCN